MPLHHDGGSIHYPEKCYYMLKRGQKHTIEKAIYRLSYLSKTNSKELTPKGVSSVIFSRLPIPEQINRGTNDILLVDARYNSPLSKIRVTPLLYSGTPLSKSKRVTTFKIHHTQPVVLSKTIVCWHKLMKSWKQINIASQSADQASALHEPKVDPT